MKKACVAGVEGEGWHLTFFKMQPENTVSFNKEQFYFVHLFISIQSIYKSLWEGINNDETWYIYSKEVNWKKKS